MNAWLRSVHLNYIILMMRVVAVPACSFGTSIVSSEPSLEAPSFKPSGSPAPCSRTPARPRCQVQWTAMQDVPLAHGRNRSYDEQGRHAKPRDTLSPYSPPPSQTCDLSLQQKYPARERVLRCLTRDTVTPQIM